jgi:hypothetical protein
MYHHHKILDLNTFLEMNDKNEANISILKLKPSRLYTKIIIYTVENG